MVDAARGVLNQLLADVYIFTDAAAGPAAGNSPGYGITLVAETTSGCLISAEAAATTVRFVIRLAAELRCCLRQTCMRWLHMELEWSQSAGGCEALVDCTDAAACLLLCCTVLGCHRAAKMWLALLLLMSH
jgi:hypothetical protein